MISSQMIERFYMFRGFIIVEGKIMMLLMQVSRFWSWLSQKIFCSSSSWACNQATVFLQPCLISVMSQLSMGTVKRVGTEKLYCTCWWPCPQDNPKRSVFLHLHWEQPGTSQVSHPETVNEDTKYWSGFAHQDLTVNDCWSQPAGPLFRSHILS